MSLKVEGIKDVEKRLLSLERNSAKRIVRRGVRAGAKVIQQEIKKNAGSMVGGNMGGLLAKHTIVKPFRRQRKGSYGVQTKFRADVDEFIHKTAKGAQHYIPNAIEYGHAAPGEAGGIKTVEAIPFVRSAQDGKKQEAVNVTIAAIERDIKKYWDK